MTRSTEVSPCPPSSSWSARAARASAARSQDAGPEGRPQRRGVCTRVFTTTPKKPNSALRKVAACACPAASRSPPTSPARATTSRSTRIVLVRGGRVKDLPGVRYKIVRGTLDTPGVREPQAGSQPLRREEGEVDMPRKGPAPTRAVLPDPIYGSVLVTPARQQDPAATASAPPPRRSSTTPSTSVEAKTGAEPVATLKRALDNVRRTLEVKSRRVGGATYQVPVEVRPRRANTLAHALARRATRASVARRPWPSASPTRSSTPATASAPR